MGHPKELERLHEARRLAPLPALFFHFDDSSLERIADHAELEGRIRGRLLAKDPDQVREGLSNVLYWRYQLEGEGQADIYAFRMGVRHWSLVEALRLFDWLEGPGLVSIEQLRLPAFRDLPACSALRMFLDPERYACLRPVHLAIHRLPGRSVLHDVSGASDGWPVTLLNEACYERWCRVCRELARAMDGPARAGGASPWRAADVERALGVLIATGEGELVLRLLELGECLPPAA